ncbi:porin family protein [Vibrio sp. SCSIO 43140]|uniref:porin family protein n=1 Tax=Vibrio sp. SCSIO 43140 TaxID=2819100 RepID=UPI0020766465|nr:porin family protein [Vibrio sp. SCSIO 43140]USD62307.1 porin family protein [Vibrio sp. SCSIO 43140]
MKKQTLALTLILGLTSGAAFAKDDYSGFRVGVGAVSGQKSAIDADAKVSKPTAKIEAGYDFNRVFSVNGSITDQRGETGSYKMKGNEAKLEGEVGYAFNVGQGWDIKPYVAAGVAHSNGAIEIAGESDRVRGTTLSTAAGVRLTTPIGIYVDGRVQKNQLSKQQKRESRFTDSSQAAVSVGFKF